MFDAAARALDRELPLIAEDLGVITPAVERLRDGLGYPGMVIVQFGFNPDDPGNPHDPGNHVEHRIAYTGTHDHDTVRGWYESLGGDVRALVDTAIDRRRRARARAVVVADPPRLRLAGPRRDGPGAGRARRSAARRA